jgi:HAD superfamily hydrolase (TIGR01509 family)
VSLETVVFDSESGRRAQLGLVSAAEHWAWLGKHFALSTPELRRFYQDFFSGDRLDEELLGFFATLRLKGVKVGLLSNYFDDARELWAARYGFLTAVDSVVISSEVGVMKPAPEIYSTSLEELGLEPGETLFLDDHEPNVRGAREVGMRAAHFTTTALAIRAIGEHLRSEVEPPGE